MSQDEIQLGRYRHYKNKQYTVLGLVCHSETQEQLVLYRPEYGERRLWVRPRAMFFEDVMPRDISRSWVPEKCCARHATNHK